MLYSAVMGIQTQIHAGFREVSGKVDRVDRNVNGVGEKADKINRKIDRVDEKIDVINANVDAVEDKVDQVEKKVDSVHAGNKFIIAEMAKLNNGICGLTRSQSIVVFCTGAFFLGVIVTLWLT